MDLLSEEIEDAALAAGLNPATGERFTLDEIIERNSRRPERTKAKIINSKGRVVDVPEGCPVPGHLIESTWCDWADGWYIYLVNGFTFREQPGPLDPEYRHSQGWMEGKEFGWHLQDGKGKTLTYAGETDATLALPSVETMKMAWALYANASTHCVQCLGKASVYVESEGYFPCPECNPSPTPVGTAAIVPITDARPYNCTPTGTRTRSTPTGWGG